MRIPPTLFSFWLVLALPLGLARPARALELPIVDPRVREITGAAYRGDVLELRLVDDASRAAWIAETAVPALGSGADARRTRRASLGLARVDRAAAALGGAMFERMFRGEAPPPAGSRDPDLAAFQLVHLPPGADLEDALERFRALPEVRSAEPVAVLTVAAVPNDSLWSSSWWFYQPSRADIHAPEAWDVTRGDRSIVIAVLDTGVLPEHPDLRGTTSSGFGNMWTNEVERLGTPGVDDDGNGFVDDVFGWDFVNLPSGAGVAAGEDWRDEDNDPNDFAGHGTAVAGLAGALTDNGIGVAGTTWNVRIMPVRMAWATQSNPLGLVDMAFAAQAIHYAWRNGANVINASWASLIMSGLDAAASAATQAGAVIVAAAGNNGQPHELADREDVIAVANTNSIDALAGSSNRGPFVDLSAPGTFVASTFVARPGTDSVGVRGSGYKDDLVGTSFAAPLVSGAVALLQSQRLGVPGASPLTPMGVRLRLRETTDDIAAANPFPGFGTGRLNMARALTDPPGSSAFRMGSGAIGAAVAIRLTSGRTRILTAHTLTRELVMIDAVLGDTIWVARLPGTPIRHIAAADMGGGRGVCLFVGTSTGVIAGFDLDGRSLPGWPVAATGVLAQPQPVLGDLDGDGVLEVVAMAGANLMAWRASGAVLPGFPIALPITEPTMPALTDLDLVPGAEIVIAAPSWLYVFNGQGVLQPGWPQALMSASTPEPPIIARVRPYTRPTILIAAGSFLHAFASNGSTRYLPRDMGAAASAGLAAADFTGDGWEEVLVPLATPALAVFDSLGNPLTAQNWPHALGSPAVGDPVIGTIDASLRPGVLAFASGGLMALNDSARVLPAFPKPGGVGPWLTLAELDDDGRTEVLAGTDARANFYIYDAGAGTWSAGTQAWPTVRGGFARTGSTVYRPGLGAVTDPPPAAIADLAVLAKSSTSVTLGFSASGEDGASGAALGYELRGSNFVIDATNLGSAPIVETLGARNVAGTPAVAQVAQLEPGRTYWFAIRAYDRVGQPSGISNVVTVFTPPDGPLAGRQGVALAPRRQPSRLPVEFQWQGPGGPPAGAQRIDVFDGQGRRVIRIGLDDAALGGTAEWNGRNAQGRLVPAGIYFARLTSGSVHAQARVVLLP